MNRKGQALVEFVLILPIFIFLIFIIFDFGMIFNKKSVLLNNTNDIVDLYKNGRTIDEISTIYKDVTINIVNEGNYDKITVTDKVKIITPGLNRVFGNPYKIKVERYIPNENE